MSKDVVELEMGEDGAYAPKGIKPKGKKRDTSKYIPREKPMIFKESHADEFLSGVDAGLDFIEKVIPRAERFFRLRG